MEKDELIKTLESLGIAFNEGIQNDRNTNQYPRIVFWEYVWEPLSASGEVYDTKVTYQVSFFSDIPRHHKLLELLRRELSLQLNTNMFKMTGIFILILELRC